MMRIECITKGTQPDEALESCGSLEQIGKEIALHRQTLVLHHDNGAVITLYDSDHRRNITIVVHQNRTMITVSKLSSIARCGVRFTLEDDKPLHVEKSPPCQALESRQCSRALFCGFEATDTSDVKSMALLSIAVGAMRVAADAILQPVRMIPYGMSPEEQASRRSGA